MENYSVDIRGLDPIDHAIVSLARTGHTLRRQNDLIIGRSNVLGGQFASIVELNAPTNFKSVAETVFRNRPTLGHISYDLRVVLRIKAQQRAVVGRHWVQHGK